MSDTITDLKQLTLQTKQANGLRNVLVEFLPYIDKLPGFIKPIAKGFLPELVNKVSEVDNDPEAQAQIDNIVRRLLNAYTENEINGQDNDLRTPGDREDNSDKVHSQHI